MYLQRGLTWKCRNLMRQATQLRHNGDGEVGIEFAGYEDWNKDQWVVKSAVVFSGQPGSEGRGVCATKVMRLWCEWEEDQVGRPMGLLVRVGVKTQGKARLRITIPLFRVMN